MPEMTKNVSTTEVNISDNLSIVRSSVDMKSLIEFEFSIIMSILCPIMIQIAEITFNPFTICIQFVVFSCFTRLCNVLLTENELMSLCLENLAKKVKIFKNKLKKSIEKFEPI